MFSRVIHRRINAGKAHDGTAAGEPAHIANLRHQLDSSGFAHTVHGPDRLILRELLGQTVHLSAQDGQCSLGGGQLLCRGCNEQFGIAVPGQSRDMAHAAHVQLRCFPFAEMVAFPLAPLAVALSESRLANQTDTLTMPERYDEINPLLAAIRTIWAGEQLVYPWKDLVSEGNEIVLHCHHILHVKIVLAGA